MKRRVTSGRNARWVPEHPPHLRLKRCSACCTAHTCVAAGIFIFAGLALTGILAGCERDHPKSAEVRIGGRVWTVELAMTNASRDRGLSGRRELPADRGMLFVFPREKTLNFCMRQCHIPIDVVFLDANGRIVNMHAMSVEADRVGRVRYSSYVPAQYALEVAGGTIKTAGLRIGQQVDLIGVPDPSEAEGGS
ncbi:MAG: hypothetical protein GVY16_06910 [Planctomycetes bacterium]|jgi:uncharacterized membrane protein (UPF0127 family)|nr:DUF192 domain-containing protein [Phycisphaerae bacterium]NBB95456.1 hypothetical protein [Planctomycetota bacterium]